MVRLYADHAAPRAFADEWPEFVEFEAMAENVAVRAGELIRQRHHRTGDRFGWIGMRRTVPRSIVTDALARQLLQQQRRDVTSAVVTDVDDQPFSVELTEIAAMEF